MQHANNKGADQPAHPRSMISAFVVRCLDSIVPLVFISEISSIYIASVATKAGLCLTWSQTPKTGFFVTRLNFTLTQKEMCPHERGCLKVLDPEYKKAFEILFLRLSC